MHLHHELRRLGFSLVNGLPQAEQARRDNQQSSASPDCPPLYTRIQESSISSKVHLLSEKNTSPHRNHLSQLDKKILLNITRFLCDFEQLALLQTCHKIRQLNPGHFAQMTIRHYEYTKGWQDFSNLIQSQESACSKQALLDKQAVLPRASKGAKEKIRVCEHVTINFQHVNRFANTKTNVQALCDKHPKCTFSYRPRLVRLTNHGMRLKQNMAMSREEKAKVPEHYWKDCAYPFVVGGYRAPLHDLIVLGHAIPCVAPGIAHPKQSLLDVLHDNKTRICEHLSMGDIVQKGKRTFGVKKSNLHIYTDVTYDDYTRCDIPFCFTRYAFEKNDKGFIVLIVERLLGNGKDPTDPCWLGALIR